MKVLKIAVAVLLTLSLAGCGNGGARPKSKKSTKGTTSTPSTTTPSTTTPSTTQPTETTKPAETTQPAETKPAETAKPAETKPAATAPKAEETLVSKPSGFENEDIGGKSIGYWVEKLNSKNKEELLEALECCKMVGGKASLGITKLNELTKNADPDIAKAANDALHQVRTVKP